MAFLSATIRLRDQFSSTLTSAARRTETFTSKLKILGHMTVKPIIAIKDTASKVIGKIKDSLFSLQGLATMALAGMGIDKLSDATIGAAMSWETQSVSMEHWLKGNKTLAQEAISWLDKFAAATPFEMTDLFPAMTRGIGISNGDIKTAERMVTIAADMSALTPGKTVGDAMEALADAQTGSFERFAEFNVKMDQEGFKALGGMKGFLGKLEGLFKGGAQKLSQTAIGKISTIKDNINTMFRNVGMGILESMKPRLDKISAWFDANQDTVNRWKTNLTTWGKQASEAVFSSMESAFSYIRSRYLDNPQFQQLDFWGKINFIMDDITVGFQTWLDGGGAAAITNFGAQVGNFIGQGIMQVAPNLGRDAGTALVSAFEAAITSSKWGWLITGIVAGGVTKNPYVGAGAAATGLIVRGINGAYDYGKSLGQKNSASSSPQFFPAHSRASGLAYVPYDNYPANLHRGEQVLTRAEADQQRTVNKNSSVIINNLTINGMNKTTKQIFTEIMDIAYAAHSNTGMA